MHPMRCAILAVLLLRLLCATALAQRSGPEFRQPLSCEALEPRTKLEAIESRYERVITKGFTQYATLMARGVEIRLDAIEMKDTTDSTRALGLVIALREPGENPRENRAFIDYEEIDRLIKGMELVGRVNESMTKLASFEGRYRTLGDLEINVFRQTRSVRQRLCRAASAIVSLVC